tara:strand:- start:1637 stop:3274 length:1638 start_codon:yes stop_codon:yes gene_type:complete
MAKQTVGLGSSANDGTGDSLRVGGDKINDNFNELYTAIGTGTALNITTAGASSNQILQWSTSNNRFEPTNSAAAGDISVDLTPQLGGDLDVNGNKIVSATNGDIELIPHGTGKIKLDTLTFPTTVGTSNYVLATDGASAMYWKQVGSTITLSADTGTNDTYTVGDTLNFGGGTGIATTVSDDNISIAIDSTVVTTSDTQSLSNKTIDNPDLTGVSTGNVKLRCATIGSFIAQGANALASFESAATYAGAFAVDTSTHKGYLASNNTWNEIATTLSSIDIFADVDTTTATPTDGQVLTWVGASTAWKPTSITSELSDDTSPVLGAGLDTAGFTISGTGNLDLTGSGSKARYDFTNTGALPSATNYTGMFAVTTSDSKGHFATSSGWINIITENDSVDRLSDVDTTTTAPNYGEVLVYTNVSGTGRWIPGHYTPQSKVAANFNVTNNGSTDFTFTGDGFTTHNSGGSQNDPVLYLKKGHTYTFTVSSGSSHPFEIRTASGGSAYGFGVDNNGTGSGTITFCVPMNAPSTLYYQCTSHAGMGNTINID